jgi:hypothetical protein
MGTFNISETTSVSIISDIIPLAPKGCSLSPEKDLSFLLARKLQILKVHNNFKMHIIQPYSRDWQKVQSLLLTILNITQINIRHAYRHSKFLANSHRTITAHSSHLSFRNYSCASDIHIHGVTICGQLGSQKYHSKQIPVNQGISIHKK